MICIICRKEIDKSYARSEFDGCYCKKCAMELGYFDDIHYNIIEINNEYSRDIIKEEIREVLKGGNNNVKD